MKLVRCFVLDFAFVCCIENLVIRIPALTKMPYSCLIGRMIASIQFLVLNFQFSHSLVFVEFYV